jgi:hypothetical protein
VAHQKLMFVGKGLLSSAASLNQAFAAARFLGNWASREEAAAGFLTDSQGHDGRLYTRMSG